MFSYKIKVVQCLDDSEYSARSEFANWCFQNIKADGSSLNQVMYSDECMFSVDGKFNERNVRI